MSESYAVQGPYNTDAKSLGENYNHPEAGQQRQT